jgi:glycosyltransferase involved in cell wall biosynthesis
MNTFISICIPAYKRSHYLKRLLDSISSQIYKNFEVIITDDSGSDNSVKELLDIIDYDFSINYIKNPIPLGSPLNWLESFKYAKGDWIKIMHDDDLFYTIDALNSFALHINNDIDCIFSGYLSFNELKNTKKDMTITQSSFHNFLKHPLRLIANNIIGPPTVMMFRKNISEAFDVRLKWIVDWEYYIRLSLKYKLSYINKPLIVVSYNDSQITNSCFRNPEIEIPEIMIFYSKYGDTIFKDILIYDSWWRLMRNLGIRNNKEFYIYSNGLPLPLVLKNIIKFQSYIPEKLLKNGFISKGFMSISFLLNKLNNSFKS